MNVLIRRKCITHILLHLLRRKVPYSVSVNDRDNQQKINTANNKYNNIYIVNKHTLADFLKTYYNLTLLWHPILVCVLNLFKSPAESMRLPLESENGNVA